MRQFPLVVITTFCFVSCVCRYNYIEWTRQLSYTDVSDKIPSEEVYSYYSDSLEVENTIHYYANGGVKYMNFDYGSPKYKKSFEMTWTHRDLINSKKRDYGYSKEIDFDEFFISHSEDDVNGLDVHVFYDGPEDHFYNSIYYTDSLRIERTVTLSEDVIDYYKELRVSLIDNLNYNKTIDFPNFNNCVNLKSSTIERTVCLDYKAGLYRQIYVDSTLYDDSWDVEREVIDYTRLEEIDSIGNITKIYYDEDKYIKKFYLADDLLNPSRATQHYLSNGDTLFSVFLTTQYEKGLRRSRYQIKTKEKPRNNAYGNLRIPIASREINVWRDKKGEITRVYIKALTNKGHVLELDKISGGEIVKEVVTIPEISKDQKYNIGFDLLYRLEIYRFDRGGKTKKSLHPKYPHKEFREEYTSDFDRVDVNRKDQIELWKSENGLNWIEVKRK